MGMPEKSGEKDFSCLRRNKKRRKNERKEEWKNGKNEDKRRKECIKQHRHTSIS